MTGGLDVDIASGRPLDEVQTEQAVPAAAADEKRLAKQADFQGITNSPAGKQLQEMIRAKLMGHIARLLREDKEAMCLLGLMQEMGMKEDFATFAVTKLMARRPKE